MAENRTRQIFIVEDHPIFRRGLADLIDQEADLNVCGTAQSVPGALDSISRVAPDLVILDLGLKGGSGMDLIQALHSHQPALPVLVLSSYDEQVYAERCLEAGARGYINKKEAADLVIEAIAEIFMGNVFLSRKMTAVILNKLKAGSAAGASPVKNLTNRELEIFILIGKGRVPGAIADELHISAKTVYSHTERIKEKLEIRHSCELVRFAALWVEREKP